MPLAKSLVWVSCKEKLWQGWNHQHPVAPKFSRRVQVSLKASEKCSQTLNWQKRGGGNSDRAKGRAGCSWKTISGCCQHFAEWCGEEEEACTSCFLKGLSSTQLLSGRTQTSRAEESTADETEARDYSAPLHPDREITSAYSPIPACRKSGPLQVLQFLAADGSAPISPNTWTKTRTAELLASPHLIYKTKSFVDIASFIHPDFLNTMLRWRLIDLLFVCFEGLNVSVLDFLILFYYISLESDFNIANKCPLQDFQTQAVFVR